MAVWKSDGNTSLPLLPLGNGKLLIWEEGAGLYNVRAGYSSPHLFSMTPDFGGCYHEVESAPLIDGRGMRHRLYYSTETIGIPSRTLCDLELIDSIEESEPIFVRRVEGITDFRFRLSIPSYVRTVYHPSYRFGRLRADTLFLTVPVGTGFDSGLATIREQTVALVLSGGLCYDPSDSTVCSGMEPGELSILWYDDPGELVRAADRLLQSFRDRGWDEAADGKTVSDSADPVDYLLAMQAECGAVVSAQRVPYAIATDLPAVCRLFLQSGHTDVARRMLLYWTRQTERLGFVPSVLLCGDHAACPPCRSDASAEAAYLLASVDLCENVSLDDREGTLLYRSMREAFASLLHRFREGMIPFDPHMQAVEAGLLDLELLSQGSAEATALSIRAAEAFAAYCQARRLRIAKDNKGYLAILQDAVCRYEKNFLLKGRVMRNAPKLEAVTRRPRFIRGICSHCRRSGAYLAYDTLELDKYGRYLCRRCFADCRNLPERTDPALRICAPRATVLAALLTETPAAMEQLLWLAVEYDHRRHSAESPLSMREGEVDALLLLALCQRSDALVRLLSEDGEAFARLQREVEPAAQTPEALLELLTDSVRQILQWESNRGSYSALLYDIIPLGAATSASATALATIALSYE
ncbi:MAG: hypothetical protein IJW62_01845 [Clostridia bacterium]|nr:hypothetical protein [Clostridia bacterium]